MYTHASDPHLYIIDPADLDLHGDIDIIRNNLKPLRSTIDWAKDFLCKSHSQLGREGAVCPFTEASFNKSLFWLAVFDDPSIDKEKVCDALIKYRDWFLQLTPQDSMSAQYKTIIVLFPTVSEHQAPDIIDSIQLELKPEFVKNGLMIGQFHPKCDEVGLWNLDFRPLRSPVPLLAIRHMVSTDFPFLRKNAQFVSAYLEKFSGDIPLRLKTMVETAAQQFGLDPNNFLIDSITGLSNSRHFKYVMDKEWRRAIRSNSPISLLMINVDFFNTYTSIYGKTQLDKYLKQIADLLSSLLQRDGDLVSYYGEAKFIVLLPNTHTEGATSVAERIRRTVQESNILIHPASTDQISVTITVSSFVPEVNTTTDTLISFVEKALCETKICNQVITIDFSVKV